MAKKKISAFTEAATLEDTDILPVVINPATIPASRKVTTAALRMSLLGNASAVTTLAEDGGVALADGTQIALEDLRGAVLPAQTMFVPPSGDTTGATDTANIQAALTALTAAQLGVSTYHPGPLGTVWLQGRYYISSPLVSGIPAEPRAYGPSVIALGSAMLEAVGDAWLATDYVLACYGNTVGDRGGHSRVVVGGIKIKASHKCRGLLLARQFHFAGIEKVHIEQTRQSALDMPTCWKSFVRDVHVLNCRGFAMRLSTVDNIRLENVRIGYARGIWHADNDADPYPLGGDAAASRNLALYEVKYGMGAAQTYYGEDYEEEWPDADDTTHPYYSEYTEVASYLQTPERERCCMWLASPHVRVSGLMMENCFYGDRPLVFIPKADNLNHIFEDMYTEVCYNTDCKVYAELTATASTLCGNLTFRNVQANDDLTDYDENAKCLHWLRLGSGSGPNGAVASSVASNVLIDGMQLGGVSTGIIVCSGPGKYNNVRVQNAISGEDRLEPEQWVVGETGAIIDTTSTAHAVSNNVTTVFEASGTATVASGDTTVDVTHGLSVTPNAADIVLTPTNISSSKILAITATSATTFTVTVDADPTGSGQTFSWRAKCDPRDYTTPTIAPGECLTNGTFDSDLTGWTNHATLPYDTAEWSAGTVHLVASGDSSPAVCHFYQDLSLEVGEQYRVSGKMLGSGVTVNIKKTSSQGAAYAATPTGSITTTIDADGYFSKLVTITEATQVLVLLVNNTASAEAWLDDLSIVPNTVAALPYSEPPA